MERMEIPMIPYFDPIEGDPDYQRSLVFAVADSCGSMSHRFFIQPNRELSFCETSNVPFPFEIPKTATEVVLVLTKKKVVTNSFRIRGETGAPEPFGWVCDVWKYWALRRYLDGFSYWHCEYR